MRTWQYMRLDIVRLFTYTQITENFPIRTQYLIITEVCCIRVMCYKMCTGINYSTKSSTSCT